MCRNLFISTLCILTAVKIDAATTSRKSFIPKSEPEESERKKWSPGNIFTMMHPNPNPFNIPTNLGFDRKQISYRRTQNKPRFSNTNTKPVPMKLSHSESFFKSSKAQITTDHNRNMTSTMDSINNEFIKYMNDKNVRTSTGNNSKDPKSFDELPVDSQSEFIAPILDSSCSKFQGFCEESSVKNYPKDLIEAALKSNVGLKPIRDYMADKRVKFKSIHLNPEEIPLCNRTEKIIYPRAGLNIEENWNFIINEKEFKQGIRIEQCGDINGPCHNLFRPPEGYKSICKQTYIFRDVVIMRNNKLLLEPARFPMGCNCYAQNLNRVLSDFTKENTNRKSFVTL